ncbi:MAG: MoxR family ATPase [Dehalococcoidia bacterium]|nr:MoxR family ATPase [Dehalococcoidia bacterium]
MCWQFQAFIVSFRHEPGGVNLADPKAVAHRISENVERVIVGKSKEVELALVAMLSQGHVLIEDVPGVGKTMLAKSLSRSIGCTFRRVQFTPDLLPSDVTGVSIYNQKTGEFEFRHGPIMAQIVLADEINRATPKTQSSLLEAMEERQMTVDGRTYQLPNPFLVLATQNPIEYEGTYPLPEAQLDRFIMRISLGYPNKTDEIAIIDGQQKVHPIESLRQVASPEEMVSLQESVKGIFVDPLMKEYIVDIVDATRKHSGVYLGASPRGSLALFHTSQARAMMQGRDFVLPDDIKTLAPNVLAHRIIISPSSRMRDVSGISVVKEILDTVPVPGVRVSRR